MSQYRLKTENSQIIQLEHQITNGKLLLQTAPNKTNNVQSFNSPDRYNLKGFYSRGYGGKV